MSSSRRVLFVCQHGAAKSVIAPAYFNRLARECGIAARATSAGTEPDSAIPIGGALSAPGVAVERWDDVPAVSAGFARARDAIVARVRTLLATLPADTPA